jgi:hypothetical protein
MVPKWGVGISYPYNLNGAMRAKPLSVKRKPLFAIRFAESHGMKGD